MSISIREKRKRETRNRLISVGVEQFAAEGYDGVSAETLCQQASVTRGALYHHFPKGKSELFLSVFSRLQNELHRAVEDAGSAGSPERVIAYLMGASSSDYRRIVWEDGPQVLGWERWREVEFGQWSGLIADDIGQRETDRNRRVLLNAMTFGAIGELVYVVAEADDQFRTANEASVMLQTILKSLR